MSEEPPAFCPSCLNSFDKQATFFRRLWCSAIRLTEADAVIPPMAAPSSLMLAGVTRTSSIPWRLSRGATQAAQRPRGAADVEPQPGRSTSHYSDSSVLDPSS